MINITPFPFISHSNEQLTVRIKHRSTFRQNRPLAVNQEPKERNGFFLIIDEVDVNYLTQLRKISKKCILPLF